MGLSDRIQGWLVGHNLPPWLGYAVLLVVALAAGYILFISPSLSSREYRISVLAEGGSGVNGALVEVFDGVNLVASGETQAGSVAFRNLPSKALRVEVTKRGYNTTKATLDTRSKTTLRVSLVSPEQGGGEVSPEGITTFTVKVLDRTTLRPISKAAVVFASESTSGTRQSDSQGTVRVSAPYGSQVSLRVSHPNYAFEALSVIASSREFKVNLRSTATLHLKTAGPPTTGNVAVLVKAQNGSKVDSGDVKVIEFTTGALLGRGSLSQGSVTIGNLPLGLRAFIDIRAPGFLEYSSPETMFEIKALVTLTASLLGLGNGAQTTFTTVTTNNTPVSAKVYVIPDGSAIPFVEVQTLQSRNGTASKNLTTSKNFYAAVSEAGYLVPTTSGVFTGGAAVRLVLERANSSNSASLGVLVTDELDNPLSGALLTLNTADGRYVTTTQTSNDKGAASFSNLRKNTVYTVNGFYHNINLTSAVTLNANSNTTLVFEISTGRATLKAVDAITRTPIPAMFQAIPPYSNNATSECSAGSDGCELRLRANNPFTISASSPGYEGASMVLTMGGGETRTETLNMVPKGFANDTRVDFLGLFDSNGNQIDLVRPGGTYTARFRMFSLPNVHDTTFHLRIGQRDSLANESTGILAFSDALSVAKATTFIPQPQCLDLNNNTPLNGMYKFVELTYAGGGSHDLFADIQISPFAPANSQLVLNYRAAARFGSSYSRSPPDNSLKDKANTSSIAGCYANTTSIGYDIVSTTDLDPSLAREYTEEGQVRFNAAKRQIETNVQEFVMQVDPLFPADALPLRLNPLEVLVESINSTEGTEGCYHLDTANYTLTFASHEINPTCPLAMRGGKAPSDESASITFYFTKSEDVKKTVPIKVHSVNATGLWLSPYESSSDNTPRIQYMVSNLQLGSRNLNLTLGGDEQNYVFQQPGVRVLALSGAGELSVSEGRLAIASATLSDSKSYFKGYSGQGPNLEGSCDSPNCCSGAWCDSTQATTALSLFYRAAQNYAKQTFFRRGNGQPFVYFNKPGLLGLTNPASIHTVIQARQGANLNATLSGATQLAGLSGQAKLPMSYDEVSMAGCSKDVPIAYDLSAQSQNGSLWNLTAKVLQLTTSGYIGSGACGSNVTAAPSIPGLLGSYLPEQGMPLCGFLYGENANNSMCVKRVDHSIAVTLEQASPDNAAYELVSSKFAPDNATQQCQDASTAYANALGNLGSSCPRVEEKFLGCSQGTTALGGCSAANCALQDASDECGKTCGHAALEGSGVCTAAAIVCSAICQAANIAGTALTAGATSCVTAAKLCQPALIAGAAGEVSAATAQSKSAAELAEAAATLQTASATSFAAAASVAGATAAAAKSAATAGEVTIVGLPAGVSLETYAANCLATQSACLAAETLADKAAFQSAACAAKQAILGAAATGAAIAPFAQDPTEAFLSSSARNKISLAGSGDSSCNAPIGLDTDQIVSSSLQTTSTLLAAIISKMIGTTGSAIGCVISGTACSVGVQTAAQLCKTTCSTKASDCTGALTNAASAASKCESTKGYLYEAPANVPSRAAWYTCYPYGNECRLSCEPKKAITQLSTFDSKAYLIDRAGLTSECTLKVPTETDSIADKSPNELQNAIAIYRNGLPVDNGFLGVLDSASNPLGGKHSTGDSSKSEPLPNKGDELKPKTTDESTAFVKDKSHLTVVGGSNT